VDDETRVLFSATVPFLATSFATGDVLIGRGGKSIGDAGWSRDYAGHRGTGSPATAWS
jgi:hypothetical protein